MSQFGPLQVRNVAPNETRHESDGRGGDGGRDCECAVDERATISGRVDLPPHKVPAALLSSPLHYDVVTDSDGNDEVVVQRHNRRRAVLVVLDFGFWSRLRDLENRDEKDELPRCNYPIAIKAHFLIKKLKLSQCAGQGPLRVATKNKLAVDGEWLSSFSTLST